MTRPLPIGPADAPQLELGLAGVLILAHDVVDGLVGEAEVAQAVGRADGAVGDAARHQQELARSQVEHAELGFDCRVAAVLEIDGVAVHITVERILDPEHALDADAVVVVLEDDEGLVGLGQHVERPKPRDIVAALAAGHEAGFLAVRPGFQTAPREVAGGGHELPDLALFVDLS